MDLSRPSHHRHLGDVADPSAPPWSARSVTSARPLASRRGSELHDDRTGERAIPSLSLVHSGSDCSPERQSTRRSTRDQNGLRVVDHGPRDQSAPMTRHERSLGGVPTDRRIRGASATLIILKKVTDLIDRAAARFSCQNRGPRATFRSNNSDDSCSVVPCGSLHSTRAGDSAPGARNRAHVNRRIDAILEARTR